MCLLKIADFLLLRGQILTPIKNIETKKVVNAQAHCKPRQFMSIEVAREQNKKHLHTHTSNSNYHVKITLLCNHHAKIHAKRRKTTFFLLWIELSTFCAAFKRKTHSIYLFLLDINVEQTKIRNEMKIYKEKIKKQKIICVRMWSQAKSQAKRKCTHKMCVIYDNKTSR